MGLGILKQVRTVQKDIAGADLAINSGASSVAVSVEEAHALLLYIVASAALTANVQLSDDGGTTWFTLQSHATGGAGNFVYRVDFPVGGLLRINNAGAGNITRARIEIVRS